MGDSKSGWVYGFAGVAIFSGSLPATRVAVAAFDPVFLTFARAGIAGVVALFGYLNRWNDSMGTTLEAPAAQSGSTSRLSMFRNMLKQHVQLRVASKH